MNVFPIIFHAARQSRRAVVVATGFSFALALASSPSAEPASKPAIDIGSSRELLVDDYLIERMSNVVLRLHEPASAGVVMIYDQPWEGPVSHQVTVFKDGTKYRMYYRGSSIAGLTLMEKLKPGEPVVPPHEDFTCYAESNDGITWTRPNLGLHAFNGSRDNNIIWTGEGTNSFAPFIDTNPAAPVAERYKAVAGTSTARGTSEKLRTLIGLVSPDGVRWRKVGPKPLIVDGMFDSLNLAFWDEQRGRYVAFYRDVDQYHVRAIKHAVSQDFLSWSPGRFLEYGEAPREHLYTNGILPYFRAPQIFLAFARRFIPGRTYFQEMSHPGVSDAVFMTSRDGLHWNRHEAAFVRPGLDERNWSHRSNTPAHGLVPTGPAQLSIYVSRNYTFPSNHLERLTWRTDGFVSARAGGIDGELLTKPLLFTGRELVLNYSTSARGSIRVEIQDGAGQPISGFSLEDSPLIFGDKIAQGVAWDRPGFKDLPPDLRNFAQKPVRLRFVMRDADLYSFQFR